MILLLVGSAFAASVGVGPAYRRAINDPFLVDQGLGLSLAIQPLARAPWLGASLSGSVGPDLGSAGLTPLTQTMLDELSLSPDLSPVRAQGQLRLELSPFHQDLGAWQASAGAQLGLGIFHTEDDLERIGVSASEAPAGTVSEWHPAPLYGLNAGLRRGDWQGRLLVERAPYTEHVLDVSERRGGWWVGTEVLRWF